MLHYQYAVTALLLINIFKKNRQLHNLIYVSFLCNVSSGSIVHTFLHQQASIGQICFYLWKWTSFELAQLLQRFRLDQHPLQRNGLLLWAVEQVGRFRVEDDGLAIDVPTPGQPQERGHNKQFNPKGHH